MNARHNDVSVVAAAIEHAARGWHVFPVPPDTKKSHKSAKHSDGRKWGATTNPDQIRRDWARWPEAGVGIVCGPLSGMFVVEADTDKGHGVDGIGNLNALIDQHGRLPNTIEAESPSGSIHYYFRWPTEGGIGNSTKEVAAGVDVRGEGGMVVGVPTVRTDGVYRWRNPPSLFELADCPEWLLALCRKQPRQKAQAGAGSGFKIDMGEWAGLGGEAGADEVREALTYIDSDESYDQWCHTLMALHHHFGDAGQPLAEEWSADGTKYASGQVAKKWSTFSAGGGLTIAYVFNLAKKHGCNLRELRRKYRFGQQTASGGGSGGGAGSSGGAGGGAGGATGSGAAGDDAGDSAGGEAGGDAKGGAAGPDAASDTGGGSGSQGEAPRELRATAFVWRDPLTIPRRPFVYGRHLLRKQVSTTLANGGLGKTSEIIVEGLAMASGRELLGEWTAGPLNVWIFNLEDPLEELERRVIAAMLHHRVTPAEVEGRLFLNSGRERGLCTAVQGAKGLMIVKPEFDALEAQIKTRRIDVLSVDPFVSSHRVGESDNGMIDAVAKEWARLADRCNIAVEIAHHTRKTNGEQATSEDGRGASSLVNAARSSRVLNRMTDAERKSTGVLDDPATYFSITRDKANLAPAGRRIWRRVVTTPLGQGDEVGVAEQWQWPDAFEGVTVKDLLRVQHAIQARWDAGKPPRYSNQVTDGTWAGVAVADVLGLNAVADKTRISKMLETWLQTHALEKVSVDDAERKARPCVAVGEWATE